MYFCKRLIRKNRARYGRICIERLKNGFHAKYIYLLPISHNLPAQQQTIDLKSDGTILNFALPLLNADLMTSGRYTLKPAAFTIQKTPFLKMIANAD
jgi:hypothetical protein